VALRLPMVVHTAELIGTILAREAFVGLGRKVIGSVLMAACLEMNV
jgi:hypothetical protein